MNKVHLFLVSFALSFAFAQEGAIKFQIPLDSTGMPVAPPPKSDTPQKLGLTANRPLNLLELSAKDTATFETYSRRRALVQDSIVATQKEIENSKKRTISQMPPLEPKGEYEKQSEFEARQAKREKELGERMIRDNKPFTDRIAELERAKKKIDENQAALYCTIDIKTSPAAASIYLNKEEIGASPAEYNLALPGYSVIKIQKENYEPWDTTLTLQPAQKLKLNITLQEKSIFSKEGEIDFPKILARDTTVVGYRERIGRIRARIAQIDSEMVKILSDFSDTYPALEPQKPEENLQEFERRKNSWRDEGIRQVGVLQNKHKAYKSKLERSIETLEDNIITAESLFVTETALNASITLGSYDVEKEVFDIEVQDTANLKSPFHFVGKVEVPRDTAKAMNRSTEGFLVGVSYLNYPFIYKDSASFNLAMKELALSRKTIPLKVDGAFKPLSGFESMEGYGPWRVHADSLLGGALKAQGLDLNYALKGEKPKVASGETSTASGDGLGWRGWTRILTFTAAAVFGTVAFVKHLDAGNNKDKIKKNDKLDPSSQEYDQWYYNDREKKVKSLNDNEISRNIFGAGAGIFAVGGIATFFF